MTCCCLPHALQLVADVENGVFGIEVRAVRQVP